MTYHKTIKIYTYISSKTLVVLVTAYRYIHLELTFMYGIRQESNFNLLHVTVQFSHIIY